MSRKSGFEDISNKEETYIFKTVHDYGACVGEALLRKCLKNNFGLILQDDSDRKSPADEATSHLRTVTILYHF